MIKEQNEIERLYSEITVNNGTIGYPNNIFEGEIIEILPNEKETKKDKTGTIGTAVKEFESSPNKSKGKLIKKVGIISLFLISLSLLIYNIVLSQRIISKANNTSNAVVEDKKEFDNGTPSSSNNNITYTSPTPNDVQLVNPTLTPTPTPTPTPMQTPTPTSEANPIESSGVASLVTPTPTPKPTVTATQTPRPTPTPMPTPTPTPIPTPTPTPRPTVTPTPVPAIIKINEIKTDKSSPQQAGTEININASLSDNDNVNFKVAVRNINSEKWNDITINGINSAIWSPIEAGDYIIKVSIYDKNNNLLDKRELKYFIEEKPEGWIYFTNNSDNDKIYDSTA